ncbi:alkanesulfonate monooxygenase SsuD/methylene tetrahydromethanopterin reductase-like flavin-dependent oxidoreductase (luciferase family) [Actinomycetospora succinea]|uniref:Alkanesulfonate monooxygenase SsuD/methylene tetrahydromethanopterin reductase-like flavin-dependent oxidoreductase (Luciferase family) n=1 Tax=Actinomycetospora succinea TaxID=663603 RepID=A0A4R6VK58_9PSEU|nr:LLM class flavin-dependent oxidoreductase [Actinomycetospora succinea]TDQ63236.1 alkanesulfonate monooxygenase SsuD/methylene tetrahydromethanopterin reductase-like flavin-dependent oxidoreductase (luciferase family) [Actinomycetospora succinea]
MSGLGVALTPMETRHDVVLHLARRAEELGYDTFTVAEAWGWDAGVLLAEVAGATGRIALGVSVINTWGRSAGTIAMLAASLDEVSGGRFRLGLGAGSPALAEGLHDVPFERPVEHLAAVTVQVRRLLRGERLEPTTGAKGLRLGVPPRTGVPLHLAALGSRSVRLAGELADGWDPFFLPRSGLGRIREDLREGAARAGRADLPVVCPGIPTAVADDPVIARAMASWWVVFYLTSMGPLYPRTLRAHGLGGAVDEVVAANPTGRTTDVPESAEVLLDELTIHGDTEQARAALERWRAAGAERPAIVLPPGRPVEELDHILDALRPE